MHPVQAGANFLIAGAPAGGAFNQAVGDAIPVDEDEYARLTGSAATPVATAGRRARSISYLQLRSPARPPPGNGTGQAHVYLAEARRRRHSSEMPTSDWESVRQLRGDALWKYADQILLTCAMLRFGLAAGWVTLVALAISGGAWIGGLPMLLASGLST